MTKKEMLEFREEAKKFIKANLKTLKELAKH